MPGATGFSGPKGWEVRKPNKFLSITIDLLR